MGSVLCQPHSEAWCLQTQYNVENQEHVLGIAFALFKLTLCRLRLELVVVTSSTLREDIAAISWQVFALNNCLILVLDYLISS